MKKRFTFAAFALLVAVSATAQLTVLPTGQLRLGRDWFEEIGFTPTSSQLDTITRMFNYGINGQGLMARISFGFQHFNNDLHAMVGNCYGSDMNPERIWIHGKYGFSITQGNTALDTIVDFFSGEDFVNFNFPVKSEGVLLTSDERLKENVRHADGALGLLSSLNGVTYNYKPRPAPNVDEVAVADYEVKNKAYFDKYYADREAARCGRLRYGFLAQELEQVLPDLVHEDKNGVLSIDYIGIIPLLVNAVNELSGELEAVKARNAELEGQPGTPAVSYAPAQQPNGVEDLLTDRNTEVLGQNDPNPFSSDTRIDYRLPEGTQTAAIYIYDLQGKQVMQLPVTQMGAGSVTLNGGNLQAGMYIYALIADGKELASKKMILTQ